MFLQHEDNSEEESNGESEEESENEMSNDGEIDEEFKNEVKSALGDAAAVEKVCQFISIFFAFRDDRKRETDSNEFLIHIEEYLNVHDSDRSSNTAQLKPLV